MGLTPRLDALLEEVRRGMYAPTAKLPPAVVYGMFPPFRGPKRLELPTVDLIMARVRGALDPLPDQEGKA